jgi:hypothetical protein
MRNMNKFTTLGIFAVWFTCSALAQSGSGKHGIVATPAVLQTGSLANQKGATNEPSSSGAKSQLDIAVDKIIAREQNERVLFTLYKPIIETYIQEMKPDKELDAVPLHDYYYLGQADLAHGVTINSMLHGKSFIKESVSSEQYNDEGFLQMIYPDQFNFDKKHYKFQLAGRDFLGDVRCLVFDVVPSEKKPKNAFRGRIWVEDTDYTIVRFSGTFVPLHVRHFLGGSVNVHFDSWRENLQAGIWLPAMIYCAEPKLNLGGYNLRFKARTNFWGYNLASVQHESEFSDLMIESPDAVLAPDAEDSHDKSPIQALREFDREAENNAIDRLQQIGLIAPSGDVEKRLDQVLNNLVVTNNLSIDPDPRVRIVLTSKLELCTVGHTILISRGLVDVLPDEATLGVVLAQGLADAMTPKADVEQYAFGDSLQVQTLDALRRFSFQDSRYDWDATAQRAMQLLAKSPYAGKLGTSALFFAQLRLESKQLPALFSPTLGNRIYTPPQMLNVAAALHRDKLDQIPARPLGARLRLDPWTDQLDLLKAAPVPLESPREKMPFEITPLMPYLTRYHDNSSSPVSTGVGSGGGK